jgi:hypothetical protein
MKKKIRFFILGLLFASGSVFAQDPEISLGLGSSTLQVGAQGTLNVQVINNVDGTTFPEGIVGVMISMDGTKVKFLNTQSGLPGNVSVCSVSDHTIFLKLGAISSGVSFTLNIEGVAAQNSVSIAGNIVYYDGSNDCTDGAPAPLSFSDEDNNNTSSQVIDIVAVTPVTLISFTGKAEGSIAVLDWATAEETEFSHFEIESSADALSFQKVGEVFAKGSNNNYTFSTAQNEDLVYYRLKMVDHDGSFAYSKIIPVSLDESTAPSFLVYPNPTVDYLQIKNKEAGVVRIIDVTGKQIRNQKVDAGIQVIDVKNLREGVYYGWLNEQSFKFVKK